MDRQSSQRYAVTSIVIVSRHLQRPIYASGVGYCCITPASATLTSSSPDRDADNDETDRSRQFVIDARRQFPKQQVLTNNGSSHALFSIELCVMYVCGFT
jgi:hypothetical protein